MPEDDGMALYIEGEKYDLDDFDLGELEWLESEIDGSVSDMDAMTSMKAVVRLVYIVKKRSNPDFTLEDARKIKVSTLGEHEEGETANGGPPPKPARAGKKQPA